MMADDGWLSFVGIRVSLTTYLKYWFECHFHNNTVLLKMIIELWRLHIFYS